MQRLLITTTLTTGLLLSGCVHQPDIQQGNLITEEMRAQVEPGMTAQSVRRTLGTPMLVSPLAPQHWVYPYVYYRDGRPVEEHALRVTFDGQGRVASVEGTVPPDGRQAELAAESEAHGTPATDPGQPMPPGGAGAPGEQPGGPAPIPEPGTF